MNMFKLYISMAQLSGYIGLGVVLGAMLGDTSSNTPFWVGGILVFTGAILLGMSITSRPAEAGDSSAADKPSKEA